jgi:PST family polysaccharide transporter
MIPLLDIIGNVAAAVWVWSEIRKAGIKVRISSLKSAVVKIRESWIYFLSSMATTAFGALNTLFVGAFCPASDVAFWGLTIQLVNAVQALYTPVTNAIYPYMIREKNFKVIKTTLTIFMPLISLGCLIIYFGAEMILMLIGGEKYAMAASLFKWFIPLLFVSFPAMLFGWPVLGAIGKMKETTKTTVITAMLQVCGLFILAGINRVALEELAILRGLTELLMCSMRMGYCYQYRSLFTKDC